MRSFYFLSFFFIALIFIGCKKDPLSGENFAGNWKCDHYTYVYWNGPDSAITETRVVSADCYMNISSGSSSQFYMGTGTANLPLVLNPINDQYFDSEPVFFDGPFAIQNNSENLDGANNWDFMESTVEFGNERELRATCQFKVLDDNHMNVKVLLRMTTGQTHKFTYALLELSK